MIVVDASAILAILLDEADGPKFSEVLVNAGAAKISPVNLWEVLVRANALHGAAGVAAANQLLAKVSITCEPVTGEDAATAFEAAMRFGRGTPAKLNLGDCFAYALARREGDGLLFKSDDFPQTDIAAAFAG